MQLPEDRVPLDEAALLISACANPGLDVAAQLRRLDGLAGQVEGDGVRPVCRVLFEDLGLQGDRETYDDPRNSYLDQVLDRGRGIPISLSVILMEVARRRGIRLEAVSMPGHFLVRDPDTPDMLIDAFDGGRNLDHAGCERLLQTVTGGAARLVPSMLAASGPWAVLARMLANLDGSYERREDVVALRWVSELRLRLPDAPAGDRTQLASRLAVLGRWDAAAGVLEEVGTLLEGPARERVLAEALALRARLN
jgi:regulator of sirC expression with transglutaminase-like and TPR domain